VARLGGQRALGCGGAIIAQFLSNPKRRNRRRSKQPFILEKSPVDTMADQCTMAELLRAPTEGYAEAIMVPPILAEHFELKHSLINMMTSDQFFRLEKENPYDHIHSLNSAAGGNLLERRTQDVLTIIENKSKVRSSQNKSIVSQVKSSDGNSSEIAKLIHAVHQQISDVTTAMITTLKQYQATPPPDFVKAVEEICVTCEVSELEKIKKMNESNIKAMQTQINHVKNELRNKMKTSMSNRTNELKNMMARFFQMNTTSTSGSGPLPSNTIANPKGELKVITTRSGLVLDGLFVPMPLPFISLEEDKSVKETLTETELTLFSNKEKLLELANTPLNENCSAVILKKLLEKLGDPGKFLISCDFSKLKCKALANLGASINLMPLLVWKKLVGKFTFLADFVFVDYESDPRVPLILERPFLRTARALIDAHGEEMILHDGDKRLNLNMRHDTSSYSNQPKKESTYMINIYDDSCEDYLKDLFATNHLSGNPTFSSHTDLTSPKVINPLSGSTTSSFLDHLLEEFVDELALITFPPGNDDLPFDIEFDLREIEYLLNHDPTKEMDSILEDSIDESNLVDPNDNLFDTIPEMFTDEHTLDYSSPPLYDDYDDVLFKLESDNNDVYSDLFDSKKDKLKVSKLLIDELDPFRSSDFLPSPDYDSFLFKDFSEVDVLPSTNNEDKVFNPGILIQENLFEDIVQATPDKNEKKISISHASLILEDFYPHLNELPFHKEVPGFETLLSFSFENEKKVFKPGILTSKGVHTSLLPELSHWGPKVFKVIKILESPMEIFLALMERTSVF
nr:hypothetical protein [Tanacetum cinerariifolium]